MRTQVDGRRAARQGLCVWAALFPLLLWQLPSAWQRGEVLWRKMQEAAGPTIVVVAPTAVAVRTVVQRDGSRTSIAVAGFDTEGCLRYAGSSEALSSSSLPHTVYLRQLPLPDCIGSHAP